MNYLTTDFFKGLGENKTLEHLNLDFVERKASSGSTLVSTDKLLGLGRACGTNNMKNGSLHHLSIRNTNMSND